MNFEQTEQLLSTHLAEVKSWAAGLAQLHARFASRFERAEPRKTALSYLVGLLSPLERKNGWQLAEAAGASRPDSIQRLLNTAKWKADEVRDELWQYIVEHLGSTQAI